MQHVIIAIHLMVVTALVALVLYQKSEGGALGMGSSGFMTGRGQANALTRATGILGTIFFLTSIALTVLPAWERGPGDEFERKIELKEIPPTAPAQPAAPSDGKESIFEQLQRAQEKRQGGGQAPATAPVAPKVEAPKVVEPPKSETPAPNAVAPKTEAPASEAPKVEPPKAEAPKSDAPKADVPAASQPTGAERPEMKPSVNDNAVAPKEPEAAKPTEPAAKAPEAPASAAPAKAPEAAAPVAPPQQAPATPAPEEKPASPPAPTIWKSPSQ